MLFTYGAGGLVKRMIVEERTWYGGCLEWIVKRMRGMYASYYVC